MSKKYKKLSLKIEYLNLELEEVEELSEKFLQEFDKEFYQELVFLKSAKKQQKTIPTPSVNPKPPPSPLIHKIYRNLAKILHPDISQVESAESEYKKVTGYYGKQDLVGLLTLANKYQLSIPDLTDEEYLKIENAIKDTEMKIKSNQTTLAWMWCNSEEEKDMLREKVYQMIGLNVEEFKKWQNTKK